MHFYQRLAGLRKDAGLSQEQLAEKAGVSRQTIFKWEAGLASPSMENILALCRIFGVSADELIGNETPEEKTENEKAESIVQNPAPVDRLFHFEYKSKRTLWGFRWCISMSAWDFTGQREFSQSATLPAV